jgi:hypothetical protein
MAKYEMHLLAYYYHWSIFDIWNISSKKRKMWVNIIKEQIKAENDANSGNKDPEYDDSFKIKGKEYKESY